MLTKGKTATVLWFCTFIGLFFLLGLAGPPETSAQVTFNLTVDKVSQSSGTGTVTATWDGGSQSCPGNECIVGPLPYNTLVTLTADPDEDQGSIFEKWSSCTKDKLDNTKCTLLVKSNKTVKAKFTETHTLRVRIEGSGAVKGTKINCTGPDTGDCSEVIKIKKGATSFKAFTLTANSAVGSSFDSWSGHDPGIDIIQTNPKIIKVVLDKSKEITATFNATQGMKIAEKVSVVDTTAPTGVKPLKMGRLGWAPPEDSDFANDETQVWVSERSAEGFSMINEILCMVGQTKYSEMLNKGDYKAQIDTNLCSSNKDDPSAAGASSQNQSSGSTAPSYEMWTVNSSRPDNGVQTVKAWIHASEDYGDNMQIDTVIFAKVVITEGADADNPYGIFTVNWKMCPVREDGTVNTALVMDKGILKTERDAKGKVLLKFFSLNVLNVPGVGQFRNYLRATLDRAHDGSTGGGKALRKRLILSSHQTNQIPSLLHLTRQIS